MTWRLHYVAYLSSMLSEQDASERTAEKYSTAWHEFMRHIHPDAGLDAVVEAASAYRRDMRRKGLAENTIRGRLAAIKSYFRWCHSRGLLPENPLAYFRLPKVESNPREVVYEEVLGPVLAALDEFPRNVRLIIALGTYAGLRAGEMRRLRTKDINLKKGTIRVQNGKGHKGRFVTILPQLERLLRDELPAPSPACPCCGYGTESFLMIGQRTGDMIARNFAYKTVEKYLDACPHQLRTTKATYSLEQGVRLDELAEELGHASTDTTAGYGAGRRRNRTRETIKATQFSKVAV